MSERTLHTFARYLNIRSAMTPVVAPDGGRVAFLTDISGIYQVWSASMDGAAGSQWPRQLTFFADKVWGIHGTAAARHLIAVGDVAGNERQQFYLISNYGVDAEGRASHEVRRLTANGDAIHRFGDWSREGDRIVYSSNARNGIDFDLYEMELSSGEERLLRECSGQRQPEVWTGDGRYLLSAENVGSDQDDLFWLDLATGEERQLTTGWPAARYRQIRSCQEAIHGVNGYAIYLLTDRTHDCGALCRLNPEDGSLVELVTAAELDPQGAPTSGELELFALTPDGKTAALGLNVDGYSRLFVGDGIATGKPSAWRQVSALPPGVIESLAFDANGQFLVFALQTAQQPSDIWRLDVGSQAMERLTFSDCAGIDSRAFVAPELIHYAAWDDRQIPALFYRPLPPPPPGGYPCILYVHGGPASQLRPGFEVSFQFFLSRGYALLAPNVRGSTGYGRSYMLLDEQERRMDSVADLYSAVTWLHSRKEIDAGRIAIYGRSYGGFMVLAALTEYPDAFAAGIDVVGIADWVTFLERTSPWRRAHREREYGSLAHHREFLRTISPIHKAERIRAPLLVMAGDNDPRVPLYESQQIVERIQAAGGVVRFVHYADEGHNFSKLANRIDSYTRMAEFLETYLGR
jgi:dipeptidyl aminopeptidase/acylaminoacyl peptidase